MMTRGGSKAAGTRRELIDVLGGHVMLISGDYADVPFALWSLRYSRHQFGTGQGSSEMDVRSQSVCFYSFHAVSVHPFQQYSQM